MPIIIIPLRLNQLAVVVAVSLVIMGVIVLFAALNAGPKEATDINDLDGDLKPLLRKMPGVASVEVTRAAGKPTRRIIHILDFHFVPKDLYAIDFQAATGRPMTDADYQEHLENVDAVRWNQLRLLPELAARYGLKKVYIERLTELDMPAMPDKLARLRDARAGQSELAKQLADVRRMLETAPPGERRDKLVAVQKEIVGLIEAYNLEMTQLGAAFSLVLNGQLEVAPLDTAALLDAANPVKDGVMAPDPAANAKRERGMISNVLNGGPVVVLICGGAHDLKSAIREIAGPDTEYVRITIYSYQGGTK